MMPSVISSKGMQSTLWLDFRFRLTNGSIKTQLTLIRPLAFLDDLALRTGALTLSNGITPWV